MAQNTPQTGPQTPQAPAQQQPQTPAPRIHTPPVRLGAPTTGHGAPSSPSHSAGAGVSGIMRNRIVQLGLGAILLVGGGIAIGHCSGKERAEDDAASQAEATRMIKESDKEALTRPHQTITISGTISRKDNGIEFKPDHNELVIDDSGIPTKITGMNIEIRMEGAIYGIITLNIGSHQYQLAKTGVTLDEQQGVKTSVTLSGVLIQ